MFVSGTWLVTLGDNVHIIGNCQFINYDVAVLVLCHKISDLQLTFSVVIGDNVFIGFGSIILPSVAIGNNVIIGAGSAVNKSIPSNFVAAGVPCRVIKTIEDYESYAIAHPQKLGHLKGLDKELKLKQFYNIK